MREILVVVVGETCDCSAACLLLCCFGPPDDAFLLRLFSPLERGSYGDWKAGRGGHVQLVGSLVVGAAGGMVGAATCVDVHSGRIPP